MAKKKATRQQESRRPKKAKKAKKSAGNKKSTASAATATNKRDDAAFPIVGIGTSAGGLEAMEELLNNMPTDTGMAFVIVTHQHPGHTSMLPELLGKETEMLVVEAADGSDVKPNHVYVAPPGGHLAIFNGTRLDDCRRELTSVYEWSCKS